MAHTSLQKILPTTVINISCMHQVFSHQLIVTVHLLGGGDFNSRVGDVSHVPPLSGARYRKNPDVNVNSHGKMVKKVCKACNVCGEQFINWR